MESFVRWRLQFIEYEIPMSLCWAHGSNLWRADSFALKIGVSVRPQRGRRWKLDFVTEILEIKTCFLNRLQRKNIEHQRLFTKRRDNGIGEYEGKEEGQILGIELGQILHPKGDSPLTLKKSVNLERTLLLQRVTEEWRGNREEIVALSSLVWVTQSKKERE